MTDYDDEAYRLWCVLIDGSQSTAKDRADIAAALRSAHAAGRAEGIVVGRMEALEQLTGAAAAIRALATKETT